MRKCFNLVPKLLLGNPLGCKALLCKKNRWVNLMLPLHIKAPKRSLGQICVPKQELGNEIIKS